MWLVKHFKLNLGLVFVAYVSLGQLCPEYIMVLIYTSLLLKA